MFVADSGRARLGPVEIGRRSGQAAQVLSGLREGERVLLHPSDTTSDGTRLAARED